jgi:glycosyltransferase involved in cell wall biosynthesis/SAM-dependent methyltransferase
MRLAFFSPMPPSRSGIADYSEALLRPLQRLADVDVFESSARTFDAALFDAAVYQLGNNVHHDFVYDAALRHPGVVVMHESNLHHLIAEVTIKRGNWDAYVEECAFNGGPAARAFAERVRRLEIGPDYEGVPMTRRVLEKARGLIVHSGFVRDEMRQQGYTGPIAVIPHGAWIPPSDRNAWRHRLGLDEATPLVGIFGHLKPYKRIAESLRAFRRVVRLVPNARMILVGEAHPEFPVEQMIRSMGLSSNVRVLGFTPIEDFVGYLGACDIVLNLRWPTVGESSGTLLRSLGLGKAVLVSEVGSFQEFPDDVCVKIPVGPGEEDLIFESLNLLISRPDVAQSLGERAREYVARECNWDSVAHRYLGFVEAVAAGREWQDTPAPVETVAAVAPAPVAQAPEPEQAADEPSALAAYLATWAINDQSRQYLETHRTRLVRTLEIIPPGCPNDRILEMGAYMQITPALHTRLGYGGVRGCYFGTLGRVEHKEAVSTEGERFACDVDLFDAERDRFPYADAEFSTVVCGELIEHLFNDPMHLMGEVNRILKPGGHFVLTTPNIASMRAVSAILQGYHPGFFHSYIRPSDTGEVDARHNREYAPREIHQLFENSGFEVTLLDTGEFLDVPHPEFGWVLHLLERYRLPANLRGDGIYAVGRKTGPVRERYPEWLYT